MGDSFEFNLHSPLTKEDWNKISDAEYENTMYVTFQTPQGRQVRYIKSDVLDKIRSEIEWLRLHRAEFLTSDNKICIDSQEVFDIIDKYKTERSGEE